MNVDKFHAATQAIRDRLNKEIAADITDLKLCCPDKEHATAIALEAVIVLYADHLRIAIATASNNVPGATSLVASFLRQSADELTGTPSRTVSPVERDQQELFNLMDVDAGAAIDAAEPNFNITLKKFGWKEPGKSPTGTSLSWRDVCEVGLHKVRASSNIATEIQRQISCEWLSARGYQPFGGAR